MRTKKPDMLPIPVRRALHKLGHDIRDARRRRTTLVKIEKGDPGVAMGHYSTVLFVMGMAERLGDVADPRNDRVGLQREGERLPQRIRI